MIAAACTGLTILAVWLGVTCRREAARLDREAVNRRIVRNL